MYIICSRCQFKVPASKHICHICGNNDLRAVSLPRQHTVITNSALDRAIQVCDLALQNTKETFSLLSGRLFTRSHKEHAAISENEPVDYLLAYKASIHNDTIACSSDHGSAVRVKEVKRKVELLDESCVTRLRLDELVHWFEDFGKDGIIIQNAKEEEAQLSDAA
jgi:hypothetical protein